MMRLSLQRTFQQGKKLFLINNIIIWYGDLIKYIFFSENVI